MEDHGAGRGRNAALAIIAHHSFLLEASAFLIQTTIVPKQRHNAPEYADSMGTSFALIKAAVTERWWAELATRSLSKFRTIFIASSSLLHPNAIPLSNPYTFFSAFIFSGVPPLANCLKKGSGTAYIFTKQKFNQVPYAHELCAKKRVALFTFYNK